MTDSQIPYISSIVAKTSSNAPVSLMGQQIERIISYERYLVEDNQNSSSPFKDNIVNGRAMNMYSDVDKIPDIEVYYTDNKNYSRATHTWIGHVISINLVERTFLTQINELNASTLLYEEAEFHLDDDLDDEDREIIKVGSVFYWSIGYKLKNGTKKKESFVRLRRFQDFTEKENDDILDDFSELSKSLKWG